MNEIDLEEENKGHTSTCGDIIKVGLKEVGYDAVGWMTSDTLESRTDVNTVMNLYVP